MPSTRTIIQTAIICLIVMAVVNRVPPLKEITAA